MPRTVKSAGKIFITNLPNAALMRRKLDGRPGPPPAWWDKTAWKYIRPKRYFSYRPKGYGWVVLDRMGTSGQYPIELSDNSDSDSDSDFSIELINNAGTAVPSPTDHNGAAVALCELKLPPPVVTMASLLPQVGGSSDQPQVVSPERASLSPSHGTAPPPSLSMPDMLTPAKGSGNCDKYRYVIPVAESL